MTEWIFRIFRGFSSGPALKLVLFWNGALIKLDTGFSAALASASLLRPDRAAEWHARAKQPQQHYPTYRYNTYRPPHPLRTVYTRYLRLNVNAGLVKHV